MSKKLCIQHSSITPPLTTPFPLITINTIIKDNNNHTNKILMDASTPITCCCSTQHNAGQRCKAWTAAVTESSVQTLDVNSPSNYKSK